jgi:uncharacterized protein (DUF2384 family)
MTISRPLSGAAISVIQRQVISNAKMEDMFTQCGDLIKASGLIFNADKNRVEFMISVPKGLPVSEMEKVKKSMPESVEAQYDGKPVSIPVVLDERGPIRAL